MSARILRFSLATILALLLLSREGWVQEPRVDSRDLQETLAQARLAGWPPTLLARVAESQVPPPDIWPLIEIQRMARDEGFPLTPFTGKIEEGLSKKVAASRIAEALRKKLGSYRVARGLMTEVVLPKTKGEAKVEHLTLMAEALEMGLPAEEMRGFLERAPKAPLPMMILGVEDLILLRQIGFNPLLAEQVLHAGLARQALTERWRALPRAVVAARNNGRLDPEIADACIKVMTKGGTVRDVLTNLGFTGRDLREGPVDQPSQP